MYVSTSSVWIFIDIKCFGKSKVKYQYPICMINLRLPSRLRSRKELMHKLRILLGQQVSLSKSQGRDTINQSHPLSWGTSIFIPVYLTMDWSKIISVFLFIDIIYEASYIHNTYIRWRDTIHYDLDYDTLIILEKCPKFHRLTRVYTWLQTTKKRRCSTNI